MARVQSVRRAFTLARESTLEATQRMLVATAKREHGRVMGTEPRPTSFTRFVDGKQGAPEDAVRPDGVIVYTYPRLTHVAQYAMEALFDLSPVLSGEYRVAHTLFLNGQAVENLRNYKRGDDVVITNSVPYARKIDLGVMTMRVPGTSRVYEQAVRLVNARYGNVAKVLFAWRGIVGGRVDRGRQGNKADARYPAMLIQEI